MSEATTAEFNAEIPPIANVSTQGQLGPNVEGHGTAMFFLQGTTTFYLYFSPSGTAKVDYGVDGAPPSIRLQPNVWTTIPALTSVNIAYAVSTTTPSDLRLLWAQ
jgi:hypothetical protein